MNTQRLNKLASFLDELPREEFDFSEVVKKGDVDSKCDAVCCAMGWTPKLFPELVEWFHDTYTVRLNIRMRDRREEGGYITIASKLFDITRSEADILFTPTLKRPWTGGTSLGRDVAPTVVALSIRRFIEWKKAGGVLS